MQICPRCNRSRRTVTVGKTQKKKHWLITRCASCAFNFDIEEWKSYEIDTAKKALDFKRPTGDADGGFFR